VRSSFVHCTYITLYSWPILFFYSRSILRLPSPTSISHCCCMLKHYFFLRRIPSRVTHRVPHTKHSTSAESLCIDAISLSLLLRRYRRDICYRFFCSPFFLSAFIQLLSLYFVALCRLLCMCPCVRKLWPLIMKTECRVYNMHICSQESLS
jgi:hypothetical protein